MKISIIVPVYNVKCYLDKCISSILKQTYKDYEILLIDDGATDGSSEKCDEYAELCNNIRVIHQKNAGLSAARNVGIKEAKGTYLMFLDSDDFFIDEECLGTIDKCFKEKIDIVAFESQIYRNGKLGKKSFDLNKIGGGYCSGKQYLMKVLTTDEQYLWMSWQYAYRREWWLQNDFGFEVGIKFEDVELTYKCLLKADKVYIHDRPVYAYRDNGRSITKTVNKHLLEDFLYVIEKNIRYVNNANLSDELKKELNNNFSYSYFTVLMMAMQVNNYKDKKDIFKTLKEKKWICEYAIHGKHVFLAKLSKVLGMNWLIYLITVRQSIRKLKLYVICLLNQKRDLCLEEYNGK